jgi:hypothetical protein
MPLLTSFHLESPFGPLDATSAGIAAGTARPGIITHRDGTLLGTLIGLGDTVLTMAQRLRGGPPDLVLLASTKGDLPRWCDHLIAGASDTGSPTALARRLSAHFCCEGIAVSAACASSPIACGIAARAIRHGRARRVLVIAGERLHPFVGDGFVALRALASGACRPYDVARDGLVLGETAAAVVLDADDADAGAALRLCGWGAAMDANHATGPSRDGAGLSRAAAAALARAGSPAPALIIGHGTGTRYNDDSESLAWARTCPGTPVIGWKGALGHSLGACGLSELVLAAFPSITRCIAGTANFSRLGCAGEISVLGPGFHPSRPGPTLLANAGFGGLNAALVIDRRVAPQTRSEAPTATLRTRVECDRHHWRQVLGTGAGATGIWRESVEGGLPRLGALEIIGKNEANWGRLDRASRALVALCLIAGVPAGAGLVLVTEAGCTASDREYEQRRRTTGADPQRFPFTLPTAPVGEASIRCGLTGPGFALPGASDAQARTIALELLADGGIPAIALARIEADGDLRGWLEVWTVSAP